MQTLIVRQRKGHCEQLGIFFNFSIILFIFVLFFILALLFYFCAISAFSAKFCEMNLFLHNHSGASKEHRVQFSNFPFIFSVHRWVRETESMWIKRCFLKLPVLIEHCSVLNGETRIYSGGAIKQIIKHLHFELNLPYIRLH